MRLIARPALHLQDALATTVLLSAGLPLCGVPVGHMCTLSCCPGIHSSADAPIMVAWILVLSSTELHGAFTGQQGVVWQCSG